MKSISQCLLLLVIATSGAVAQPTLTATTTNPVVSDFFRRHICDTTGVTPGTSGAGVTWNFSGLTTIRTDKLAFAACIHPYIDSFPSSTIAATDSVGDIHHFSCNASKYEMCGNFSSGQYYYYTKPDVFLNYPTSYGTRHLDTTITYITSPTYPDCYIDSMVCDGYGSIILPSGTYSNVLRTHYVIHAVDYMSWTPYARIERFFWWTPGVHLPLLIITYSDAELDEVQYATQPTLDILDIANNAGQLEVNPNPTNSNFQITGLKDGQYIELYDMTGRLLKGISISQQSNIAVIADVPAGNYLLLVKQANGTVCYRKTLVKN